MTAGGEEMKTSFSMADRAWSCECRSDQCSSPKPYPPVDVCSVPEAFGSSTLMLHRAKGLKIELVSGNPFCC